MSNNLHIATIHKNKKTHIVFILPYLSTFLHTNIFFPVQQQLPEFVDYKCKDFHRNAVQRNVLDLVIVIIITRA